MLGPRDESWLTSNIQQFNKDNNAQWLRSFSNGFCGERSNSTVLYVRCTVRGEDPLSNDHDHEKGRGTSSVAQLQLYITATPQC